MAKTSSKESKRLVENKDPAEPWYEWGTYLSERQWGTVREDYSADGAAWDYLPHDHARSRAYRWGEDGLLGWSDRYGLINFGIALWNGNDPILKERLFGLTNSQGNHGEDVKELYYFLEGLPSASYMKGLYKYPRLEFPYEQLVEVNRGRSKLDREFELLDTGIFDHGYFDVQVEYAKPDSDCVAIRLRVTNHSQETAPLTLLPQIWYRNTWSWDGQTSHQMITALPMADIHLPRPDGKQYWLWAEGDPILLFTENETNCERLFGTPSASRYVKDAFHRYIVDGDQGAVNPALRGSKAGMLYEFMLAPGESKVVHLLLSDKSNSTIDLAEMDALFKLRIEETAAFYRELSPDLPPDAALVQRQAMAGLLWSKQYYHFDVNRWLLGDINQPPPPTTRNRNEGWRHVHTSEIFSMPDSWEYPWFAAWDLAFHTVAFAMIDPQFAKDQLVLLDREWLMHPNGQLPAYEWAFGDVNPPVHAWAAWRVYTIDRKQTGVGDRLFLERTFHKLLLNFTWWVNRKDLDDHNVFEGGFLGLDNIGLFDRNMAFEEGIALEQSDGTSWMGMFCLNMLTIALELAEGNPAYEDVASKFFEHFLYIASAMNNMGHEGFSLWDDEDGFFYDVIHRKDGSRSYVKVRSAVGIIPLFAVTTLDKEQLEKFPAFRERLEWFLEHRPSLTCNVASMVVSGKAERRLLSIATKDQIIRILARLLDEAEFLSPCGLRALSKAHESQPYGLEIGNQYYTIDYEPGESTSGAFGGNSNWRGPIWMPINYLLIEALQQFDHYYGNSLTVPLPSKSGSAVPLSNVAAELEKRLLTIFLPDANGNRPVHDGQPLYQSGAPWQDLVLFYEYFHGDSGRGVGASHQTGWTALIAKIINQLYVTAYSDLA